MRYWKRVDGTGKISTVESYSHGNEIAGAVEITEAEFQAFIASLPPPPPPIDWKAAWLAADTAAKKLSVIAKRLGLE